MMPHENVRRPGLYVAVRPIPPATEIPGLCRSLEEAFSAPGNTAYLDALTATHTNEPSPARLLRTAARLGALSLLPDLIRMAGQDPSLLQLNRDAHGRPFITSLSDADMGLDFNLSHSDAHVACALLVSPEDSLWRVGIDVEELIPPARCARLAARYASEDEQACLQTDTALGFTKIWTIREALSKQDGLGMPLRFDAAHPPAHVCLLCGQLPDTGTCVTICLPVHGQNLSPVCPDDSLSIRWTHP